MKALMCSGLSIVILFGIFFLLLDARRHRLAERRESEASAAAIQMAFDLKISALKAIKDSFDQQYHILHSPVAYEFAESNKIEAIWDEYYSSYKEAQRQLAMTNLDLSLTNPSTKYIDDEVEIGMLQRTR